MSTTITTSGKPRTTPRVGPRPSSGRVFWNPTRSRPGGSAKERVKNEDDLFEVELKREDWRKRRKVIAAWMAHPDRIAPRHAFLKALGEFASCRVDSIRNLMLYLVGIDHWHAANKIHDMYQGMQDVISMDEERTREERRQAEAELLAEREAALERLQEQYEDEALRVRKELDEALRR